MFTQKISVVIPTRNRVQYLMQALDSVFAQTYPAAEIIVVDDGSTDVTRERLESLLRAHRIRYVFQNQNGVSAARNKGIELANFPYIAFLDSDDLFLPAKLEKQIALFQQQPDLGFVHCCYSKFNDEGHDLGIRDTSRFSGLIYPSMLLEWSMLMAMPCMLVRTDVIKEVSGFDQEMIWAEDMDLWRRISFRYEVGCVPEVLVRVRVHSSSVSLENRGEVSGFKRYLEKAFEDDPSLSGSFKRKVMGRMYANLGQNILGNGTKKQMHVVRRLEAKALSYWPELSAIASWFISFLPISLRNLLVSFIRRRRYFRKEEK